MRRSALAALVLSACSFDPAGLGRDAGPGSIDARALIDAAPGTPDAPPSRADAALTALPCPNDNDLIACFRFETGNANLEPRDESKYKNNGVAENVTFVPGPDGHGLAMSFGPASSVLVPDSASLDPRQLTLELWLYVRSLPPTGGRAGLLDDNNEYGLFLAPDGSVRCVIGSTTDTGLAIPVATWTHVACTYDGATIALYQNGLPGPVTVDPNGIPTTSVDGLGLGQNVGGGTPDHLDGAEDDVWLWQTPRAQLDLCTDAKPACP